MRRNGFYSDNKNPIQGKKPGLKEEEPGEERHNLQAERWEPQGREHHLTLPGKKALSRSNGTRPLEARQHPIGNPEIIGCERHSL